MRHCCSCHLLTSLSISQPNPFVFWWNLKFLTCALIIFKGHNKAGTWRTAPAISCITSWSSFSDLCATVCHCQRKSHDCFVTSEANSEHGRRLHTIQGRLLGGFCICFCFVAMLCCLHQSSSSTAVCLIVLLRERTHNLTMK